jgi:hypothetical protein
VDVAVVAVSAEAASTGLLSLVTDGYERPEHPFNLLSLPNRNATNDSYSAEMLGIASVLHDDM